jgi:THAP domain
LLDKENQWSFLYRFPKDIYLFEQWILAIEVGINVTVSVATNACVCGHHFKKNDYFSCKADNVFIKRQKLKREAIPSIFGAQELFLVSPSHHQQSRPSQQFILENDDDEHFECYDELEVTNGSDNEERRETDSFTDEIYEGSDTAVVKDLLRNRDSVLVNLDVSAIDFYPEAEEFHNPSKRLSCQLLREKNLLSF